MVNQFSKDNPQSDALEAAASRFDAGSDLVTSNGRLVQPDDDMSDDTRTRAEYMQDEAERDEKMAALTEKIERALYGHELSASGRVVSGVEEVSGVVALLARELNPVVLEISARALANVGNDSTNDDPAKRSLKFAAALMSLAHEEVTGSRVTFEGTKDII